MGFAAQSEFAVHFGIPDSSVVRGLTIRWPSGRIQEFTADQTALMLNRHLKITESHDGRDRSQ
jgi:hypothetical protein